MIWTAGAPPEKTLIEVNFAQSYVCGSDKSNYSKGMLVTVLLYNAIILAATTWISFSSREMVTAFQESTTTSISSYNTAVIAIIAIPLIYLSGSSFNTEAIFLIKSLAVLVSAAFILLSIFGLKLYILYFAQYRNTIKENPSNYLAEEAETPRTANKEEKVWKNHLILLKYLKEMYYLYK